MTVWPPILAADPTTNVVPGCGKPSAIKLSAIVNPEKKGR